MIKRKRIRQRGKLSLTRYFQRFDSGDFVALVRDLGKQSPGFPKRMHGRTGKIVKKQGKSYIVELNDYNKAKRYNVMPIHLKKIEVTK